jgi:hypothetical protein
MPFYFIDKFGSSDRINFTEILFKLRLEKYLLNNDINDSIFMIHFIYEINKLYLLIFTND